jgi:sulfide:quinone oxidoreductase
LSRADVDAFAAALRDAPAPVVAHCRSGTRSALLWALVRMREGADALSLIATAAQYGIDIASLPAVAARLR